MSNVIEALIGNCLLESSCDNGELLSVRIENIYIFIRVCDFAIIAHEITNCISTCEPVSVSHDSSTMEYMRYL